MASIWVKWEVRVEDISLGTMFHWHDRYILVDSCWAWPIWLIVVQADQNVNLKFEWFVSRLTDWRTSWWVSRRSWRGSPRSWSRPSLRCPDIRSRQCPDIRSKHSSICLDTSSRHVPKCLNIRCRNSSKCLDFSSNLTRFLQKCWNVNSTSDFLSRREQNFIIKVPGNKICRGVVKSEYFHYRPTNLAFLKNQHSFLLPCHHPFSNMLKPQTISVRLDSTCVSKQEMLPYLFISLPCIWCWKI